MLPDVERRALLREKAATPEGAWVRCGGTSMLPTVRPGQRVRVHATRDLRPGHAVLFETGDRRGVMLHRLVAVIPGTPFFLHIGDNDGGEGPRVARRAHIIGRAELPRRLPAPRVLGHGVWNVTRTGPRRLWNSLRRRPSA